MMRTNLVKLTWSLLLLGRCSADQGVGEGKDGDGQDMLKEILGSKFSGYESKDMQKDKDEPKECSSFTVSAGLRCVSYHNCDENGSITKHDDKLIDIRERDNHSDVKSLYCPGKSDICCKDPEFVSLSTLIEEVLESEEEPENEATSHLLHEENELGPGLMDENEEYKECPPQWQTFLTNCYFFGPSPKYLTWAGAASACAELHENSTLPSIHSEEEDQFIQGNVTSHPFWLGGSRKILASYRTPSSWTWSDGTAMNFTDWASGQPNNYWWGERCVRSIESGGEGTWDDHRCWSNTALAVVCKLEL